MSDSLFTPIAIGGLSIKNRILMPAMHMNMCRNFAVSDRLIRFYRERAEGGAGAIVVGYATVDEYSGGPGNIGCHHDDHIPGLTRLAAAIKEGGARAGIQLNHAGRYNPSFFLGGRAAVAPSPVPSRLTRETPRELSLDEIAATIRRFSDAAGRAHSRPACRPPDSGRPASQTMAMTTAAAAAIRSQLPRATPRRRCTKAGG